MRPKKKMTSRRVNQEKGKGSEKACKSSNNGRNRASPAPIVKTYEHLSIDQKSAIKDMGFGSLLDIKCQTLHNPLLRWVTRLYDAESRSLIVPGRGRIPLTEESVYHVMGIPRGAIDVKYYVNTDIEDQVAETIFLNDGLTPRITRVGEILKDYKAADERFKHLWMIYVVCTLISPTTCNNISNRCYPFLQNINAIQDMNWCKFVANKLHDLFSRGKYSMGCLLHVMLLYVDSLDCSEYNMGIDGGLVCSECLDQKYG